MKDGWRGKRLAGTVGGAHQEGVPLLARPERGQPAPRRAGLGPEEEEAIPAAPARGGSAASAVHREEEGDRRGGGGGLRGRGAAPSCRLLSFFHPGVPGNGNGPRPGRSARMKGGPRPESRASSRPGGGNWQRGGYPATPASQSGRRGQPRLLELGSPKKTHSCWHLATPTGGPAPTLGSESRIPS